jgi:hypothetical protein
MIDIAVFTCAAYAHLIPTWLHYFERTFPLPYRLDYIVAGTDTISVPGWYSLAEERIRFVSIKDNGFASNMLTWMRDRDDPVMMMMDDHMLFEADAALLAQAWDIVHRTDVGCVRLVPWPGPTLPYDVGGFGEIDKTREYAISLQASMWKPQTLRDLIEPGWNPWEIEIFGSKRAADYGARPVGSGATPYSLRFIGCKTCAMNYKDYMLRGKPRPEHAAWVDERI